MIRIDYKADGEYVKTIWVQEDSNSHTLMGRITFTKLQFETFRDLVSYSTNIYIEKKE